jgi:hypothetical protein
MIAQSIISQLQHESYKTSDVRNMAAMIAIGNFNGSNIEVAIAAQVRCKLDHIYRCNDLISQL